MVVAILVPFFAVVCALPMAHRITTPQILLEKEDSEQESILGGLYAEKSRKSSNHAD